MLIVVRPNYAPVKTLFGTHPLERKFSSLMGMEKSRPPQLSNQTEAAQSSRLTEGGFRRAAPPYGLPFAARDNRGFMMGSPAVKRA